MRRLCAGSGRRVFLPAAAALGSNEGRPRPSGAAAAADSSTWLQEVPAVPPSSRSRSNCSSRSRPIQRRETGVAAAHKRANSVTQIQHEYHNQVHVCGLIHLIVRQRVALSPVHLFAARREGSCVSSCPLKRLNGYENAARFSALRWRAWIARRFARRQLSTHRKSMSVLRPLKVACRCCY